MIVETQATSKDDDFDVEILSPPVTMQTVMLGLWIIPSVLYGRILPMLVLVSYKCVPHFPA